MSETKHTPEPWVGNADYIIGHNQELICSLSEHHTAKVISERIVECVNACAGQNIEDVKLATAHKDACFEWERTMMELVGEDGPGSVREAVNKLKAERDDLNTVTNDMSGHISLIEEINSSLKTQRDELAEALQSLIQTVITENPNAEFGPAIKKARAIISNYQS